MVSTPNTQGLYGAAADTPLASAGYAGVQKDPNDIAGAANAEWSRYTAEQERIAAEKKAAEEKAAKDAAAAAAAAAAKKTTQPRNILAELAMRGGAYYPGAYGVFYSGGYGGGGGGGGGGSRSSSAGYGSSSGRARGSSGLD